MPKSNNQRSHGVKTQAKTSAPNHNGRAVDFVLECDSAEHVYVCGDFNDWQPTSLHMIRNSRAGLWEKRLTLAPGHYEYKFLVDGEWVHDSRAKENVRNIHGSLNSVIEVLA